MYTVVGSRTNRTFRVLWALEELGIEYDHKPYSVRSPEALQHSPTGKLPALIAEDEVITCLLYTSPSPRDLSTSRMPSSA